jgi:DNA-binding NtrC family response regulator
MLGNANLARLDQPRDSAVSQALTQIERAAMRAADLCQQMLAYAGSSPLSFANVDLNELIEDSNRLLGASVSKRIMVDFKGDPPLAEMRRLDSTGPVILMSGFSQKLTIDNFSAARPSGMLAKPFDFDTLRARLESVLAAPAS